MRCASVWSATTSVLISSPTRVVTCLLAKNGSLCIFTKIQQLQYWLRSSFADSISIPMMWLPVAIFFTISWLTWARRSCHTLSVAELVLVTGLVTGFFGRDVESITSFPHSWSYHHSVIFLHDLGLILGDNDHISTFRDAIDWHQVHCQLRDA